MAAVAVGLVRSYTSTSNCIACFNTRYSYKFCLTNWASTTGYCCDKSLQTDYCSSERYYCSDNAPNNAVKLSYCPFNSAKCYGKPIDTLDVNIVQTAATTLAFTKDDVCSWKLRAVSEYYFNKQIKVMIETTNGVDCHLANGNTMATASTYIQCQGGKTYYFDANQHVFIVASG